MIKLPKLDLSYSKIISWKISTRAAIFVLVTIVLLVMPLLALPAQASPSIEEQEVKLNGAYVINFPLPVQRDHIKVKIEPEIDVDLEWEGALFNQKLKITPKDLLAPEQTYKIEVINVKNSLGITSSKFDFKFQSESYPKVFKYTPINNTEKITPNQKFHVTLDRKVSYGEFKVISSPHFEASITKEKDFLTITPETPLKQGEKTTLSLWFVPEGLPSIELLKESYEVVTPLKIVSTNPKQGIKNVSKKTDLTISFNKEMKTEEVEKFLDIKPKIEGEFSLEDSKTIQFKPNKNLPTDTEYQVTVKKEIEATDGAILEKDFILKFKIAGAVAVVAASPQSWGVPLDSSISVTFDQPVDKESAQGAFIITPSVEGSFNWSGSTMYFNPFSNLSLFKDYSFSLSKGITSPGGDPSTKGFTYSFKTTLERVRSLGTTSKGNSINTYYFGVGAKKILLVGAMHGTEANTTALLNEWVVYLRNHQNQIPTDRTFVIVPNSNPDGVASGSRFNARGVDLNRNFQTDSWQKDTYWNAGVVKNGGGTSPFSEIEARALRDLILKENPRITISYHSFGGVVVSDGKSNPLRDWYASKTGYTNVAGAPKPAEDVFKYEITGSLEEWMGELGKIVIIVELATSYYSEFTRNLPALKGLLSYPL